MSQLSVTSSNTSLQDGLSSSSALESGHLLDFLPAYSGVSFLKHQRKSSYSKSGSDNGIELPRSSDEEQFGDLSRQCVSKPKLASEKSNLPKDVEVLNPLTKSVSNANSYDEIRVNRQYM